MWRRENGLSRSAVLLQNSSAFVEEDAFEIHFERLRIGSFKQCLLLGDFSGANKLEEGLIEIDHAFVVPGLDGRAEFIQTVFFDQLFDRSGIDHDFEGRCNRAGDGGDHPLANDSLHGAGELAADLLAFIGFEKVQNAADRLRCVGGVDRGEDEVTGVGGAHGGCEAG